jgi:hypothetical protein
MRKDGLGEVLSCVRIAVQLAHIDDSVFALAARGGVAGVLHGQMAPFQS